MTKIKICGLSRSCDVDFINEAKPDFCGFIINVPGSRRTVSPETVRVLCTGLNPRICPVGVFVNSDPIEIIELVRDKIISAVQLHGSEDKGYIAALRKEITVPIIKAYSIRNESDLHDAEESSADYILLDHGKGGTGIRFDWNLAKTINRPFILAGGLTPDNLSEAVNLLRPWAVDLSSGVETEGKKDREKILSAVNVIRGITENTEVVL